MAGRKYITYHKLWSKISSYRGNSYKVEVVVPQLKPPSATITDSEIKDLEKYIDDIQKAIKQAVVKDIELRKKESAINDRLKSPLMGNNPEFNLVKRVTPDGKARIAEYERMRKSLNSSRSYYRRRYGVEMPAIPKLDKNVVPRRSQLERLERNIKQMKQSVRLDVSEEKTMMNNIKEMIRIASKDSDVWVQTKADEIYNLLVVTYNNNPRETAKKLRNIKEELDAVVERFLYIAYETTASATNKMTQTMTTEAWDIIEGALTNE